MAPAQRVGDERPHKGGRGGRERGKKWGKRAKTTIAFFTCLEFWNILWNIPFETHNDIPLTFLSYADD